MTLLLEYGAVLPIVFAAFFLKTMTGFGAAIVLVSLGSLFFPVQEMIILCVLIDLVANISLVKKDWRPGTYKYWLPLCITMMCGAVVGGILLKVIDPSRLNVLMGVFVLALGGWLFFKRGKVDELPPLPERSSITGMCVTGIAGVFGGMLGISGPPIVWYFGQRLSRPDFRMVVVPIFWSAAVAGVLTYLAVGLLTWKLVTVALMCMPVVALAVVLGGRVFNKISERRFGQMLGFILVCVAVKLLFA